MTLSQTRKRIMEFIINGNNSSQTNTSPNNVILEPYVNRGNNIEYNYLPFIDIDKNVKTLNNTNTVFADAKPIKPNDDITKLYIIGLSCLGLYMLNSILQKK